MSHMLDTPEVNIDCLLVTKAGKCVHPDYRGFLGPRACVHLDTRCTGCKIQVKPARPVNPPPRKP